MINLNINLDADGQIDHIIYPHYEYYYLSKKDIQNVIKDLKEINFEMVKFQNSHNCFESEKELKSEILYAQYKYIEDVKFVGKVKKPINIYIPHVFLNKEAINENISKIDHKRDDSFVLGGVSNDGLAYYLYWRNKILNYEYIKYNKECLSLLINELLIGTINNSSEIVYFLNRIYQNDDEYGNLIRYELNHVSKNLQLLKNGTDFYILNNNKDLMLGYWFLPLHKIFKGDFENCYDTLCHGTHYSTSTYFFKRYDLKDLFLDIFYSIIPKVSSYVNSKGYCFNNLFVAKKVKYNLSAYCTIFTNNTLMKNSPELYDYHVSENVYVFRKMLFLSIENSIRNELNYKMLETYDSQIEKCYKCNDFEQNLCLWKIFIDDLLIYIDKVVKQFLYLKYDTFITNIKEQRKKFCKKQCKNIELVQQTNINKKNPREEMKSLILTEPFSLEKALNLYDTFTLSVKQGNKRYFYTLLFGMWIINSSNISFESLINHIGYDIDNKISINSLFEFNSIKWFHYIKGQKDIYNKQLSKVISLDFVDTCLFFTYYLFITMCLNYDLDYRDILLGKENEYEWKIFGDYISNDDIQVPAGVYKKNLFEIEKYTIKIDNNGFAACVRRSSYSDNSKSLIKYINTIVQTKLHEKYLLSIKSIKSLNIDYSNYNDVEREKMILLMDNFLDKLTILLDMVIIYNKSLDNNDLLNIIFCNPLKKRNSDALVEELFKVFYGVEFKKINRKKLDVIKIDYLADVEDFYCKDKIGNIIIPFSSNKNFTVYKNRNNYIDKLTKIFEIDDVLDEDFDIEHSYIMSPKNFDYQSFFSTINILANNNYSFQQWILRIERGEVVVPTNKHFIILLFYYFINGYSVTSRGMKWNLIIMIQLWNHEFKNKFDGKDFAIYLLELLLDYKIVYCDAITLREFKSYFCYDLLLEGEKSLPINIGKCKEINGELYYKDILKFYNDSMNYKYLQTTSVKKSFEYTNILKESLKRVDTVLTRIWSEYGRVFYTDFLDDNVTKQFVYSVLFKKVILLDDTIDRIKQLELNSIDAVGKVNFILNRNYFLKEINSFVINREKQYALREYIFKLTETALRSLYDIPCSFSINSKILQDFDENLYNDNSKTNFLYIEIYNIVKDLFGNDNKITFKNSNVTNNDILSSNFIDNTVNMQHTIENKIMRNELKKIDKDSLEEARKTLLINQNRLVIEDEIDKQTINEDINKFNFEEELFDDFEKNILRLLLNEDMNTLREVINGRNLDLIIEKINEKSLKLIEDNIIDTDSKTIFNEYLDVVKEMI